MNELADKLIIRFLFTLFIIFMLYLYKLSHKFLYPSSKKQIFKKFFPSTNSSDSLHFFSRVIGIGIIFSGMGFQENSGLLIALVNFFTFGVLNFVLFLTSLFILESIVLYNFDYVDEILKRKNMGYATITFTMSLSLAFLMKTIYLQSGDNLIVLFMLWLFANVLLGFASKFYKLVSNLHFNQLLTQKNLAISFSYSGFLIGCVVILISVFEQDANSIKAYSIQIILKVLLSIIIFPIFRKGIKIVFGIKDDKAYVKKSSSDYSDIELPEMGYGIYEGATFFTACLFTSIITGHIHFGTIYPIFQN